MNSVQKSVVAVTALLLSSCGGSSGGTALNGGSTDGNPDYDYCTAPFYETVVGSYKGTVVATEILSDGSTPWHTCEWDIEMDWRGVNNGIPGLCELKVDFGAKVTRSDNYGISGTTAVCIEIDQTFWTFSAFFSDDDYIQSPSFPIDISVFPKTELHPINGLPEYFYMTPITGETAYGGEDVRLMGNGAIETIPRSNSVFLTSDIYKQ